MVAAVGAAKVVEMVMAGVSRLISISASMPVSMLFPILRCDTFMVCLLLKNRCRIGGVCRIAC